MVTNDEDVLPSSEMEVVIINLAILLVSVLVDVNPPNLAMV